MGEMRWDREGNARGEGRQGRKDKMGWDGMEKKKKKRKADGLGSSDGKYWDGIREKRKGQDAKKNKTTKGKEPNPRAGG
jgi:hypothetical protein